MEDYRLDEIEKPAHHPDAVRRLSGTLRRPGRRVDFSGGLAERDPEQARKLLDPNPPRDVNAGVKMHRLAGVKVHHG
jgi:hypothetical protein